MCNTFILDSKEAEKSSKQKLVRFFKNHPLIVSFVVCHEDGQNLPAQLNPHLGVSDSNSVLCTYKSISKKPKLKKKVQQIFENGRKIKSLKKVSKNFVFAKMTAIWPNLQYFEL